MSSLAYQRVFGNNNGAASASSFAGGTITSPIKAPAGTAGAPAYSFSTDTTSGMFLVSAGNPAISAGGQQAVQWAKDTGAFPIIGIGTAPVTAQTVTIKGQSTGAGTDNITSLDSSGTATFRVTSNGRIINAAQILVSAGGSAASPIIGMNSGGTHGMYSTGSGLGLTSAGASAMTFGASQLAAFVGAVQVQAAGAVRSGSAAPSGGSDGDIYMRTGSTAGSTFYVKISGAWTAVA